MSWDSYVENLTSDKKLVQAAIIGIQGGIWAASPDLKPKISKDEESKLLAAFANPDDIFTNGLHFGGVRYTTIQADEGRILGKKGADGICISKTNLAVLIGIYGEGTLGGDANNKVESLADHLKKHGS